MSPGLPEREAGLAGERPCLSERGQACQRERPRLPEREATLVGERPCLIVYAQALSVCLFFFWPFETRFVYVTALAVLEATL